MIKKLKRFIITFWLRTSFIILGFGSLIWFIARVIPKPSRVQHPCMKVAAPMASSFVAYLLGITAFTFLIKKTKDHLQKSKYLMASVFVMLGLIAGTWIIIYTNSSVNATDLQPAQTGNEPIGVAKGTIPGRVVWVHDPEATNEDCPNDYDDAWYESGNTDQSVVSSMVSTGLKSMTGATTDAAAWDSIFHYYNRTHGRGDVGYTAGEKIAIKINLNAGDANPNINTSPQVCYAILNQLINTAGVNQSDIGIGDPISFVGNTTWNVCHSAFSNVKYWGSGSGRTSIIQSDEPVFKMSSGDWQNYLPQQYLEATYMINIPVFKKHHRAGISLSSKNHFGSIGAFTGGAWHMHPYLPCPEASGDAVNGNYGVYRVFVDIMGHKDLGGKTILYLIDGLWSSVNWGHPPVKWEMTPFNNDWPSSLFLSQDPVAIESVGFDFLYHEFDEDHPTEGISTMGENAGPFPHFAGTDDFLHQAADPTKWPAGFSYDPEDDGTIISSLGTHEHWNNATEKKYSRNLATGSGIELIYIYGTTNINTKISELNKKISNYPNPFKGSTTIRYYVDIPSDVQLSIFNTIGELIKRETFHHSASGEFEYIWDTENSGRENLVAGTYICTLEFSNNRGTSTLSEKMILVK